jgi:uncharacterized protein (DUF58 family)
MPAATIEAVSDSLSVKGKLRRRYHVHGALLVYSFVTLLIAIGAFNSQNNLLYWLFGLAIGLILVSGIISGGMMMGVRVERESFPDAVAGGPVRVRYRITNRNRFTPAFALTLTELVEPGTVRGWSDRLSRGLRKRLGAGGVAPQPGTPRAALEAEPIGFCAYVPARGTVIAEVVAKATPDGRGRLLSRGLRVSTSFPFGIILKSVELLIPGGCIVQPAPEELDESLIRRAWGSTPGDTVQVRRAGHGEEFLSLRAYVPGDSPRSIAWKASARSVDLLVRQNAAPAPRRTWVVLDLSRQHDAAQRERAIALAAGGVHLADRLGRAVGLVIPAMGVFTGTKAGGWHIMGLLNDLALIPRGAIDTGDAAIPALSRAESRTAIVVHAGEPGPGAALGDEAGVHLWSGEAPEPTIGGEA